SKAWSRLAVAPPSTSAGGAVQESAFGIDPALFGTHPHGAAIDPASIWVQAPSVIEVRLPADLAAGATLVTTGMLPPEAGGDASVQMQVLAVKPAGDISLVPSPVATVNGNGPWTSSDRGLAYAAPIVVNDDGAARKRFERAFDDFRQLFPAALCYSKIVPVDEVVTLTLYHREDEPLKRLMLSDDEARRLDLLWEELHFVSHDALTLVDAFLQLLEYASQDADPKVFEPMRGPINERAAAFRAALVAAEPKQIDALVNFA